MSAMLDRNIALFRLCHVWICFQHESLWLTIYRLTLITRSLLLGPIKQLKINHFYVLAAQCAVPGFVDQYVRYCSHFSSSAQKTQPVAASALRCQSCRAAQLHQLLCHETGYWRETVDCRFCSMVFSWRYSNNRCWQPYFVNYGGSHCQWLAIHRDVWVAV